MFTRHGYPIILVDKVLEREQGKRVKCLKNVSLGEPIFRGHFQDNPILPGVYTVEGLCQSAQILIGKEKGVTAKLESFKFSRQVLPGDRLIYEIELDKIIGSFYLFNAKAFVDGELVCKGKITGHFLD